MGMFLVFIHIIVSLISAHHVCKLSRMVSLRYLPIVNRKRIEEVALQKLKRGESTRNVVRDLQVFESWVAKICKQHLSDLSDVNCSLGGKPRGYSVVD